MPTIWGHGIHAGVPWDVGIEDEMEYLLESFFGVSLINM